ncbi:MAG: hypothetical protein JSS50_01545, partial [Proteobacteria bacterium]|nr:hypothetical protein [Pseudomonadota bacterium]
KTWVGAVAITSTNPYKKEAQALKDFVAGADFTAEQTTSLSNSVNLILQYKGTPEQVLNRLYSAHCEAAFCVPEDLNNGFTRNTIAIAYASALKDISEKKHGIKSAHFVPADIHWVAIMVASAGAGGIAAVAASSSMWHSWVLMDLGVNAGLGDIVMCSSVWLMAVSCLYICSKSEKVNVHVILSDLTNFLAPGLINTAVWKRGVGLWQQELNLVSSDGVAQQSNIENLDPEMQNFYRLNQRLLLGTIKLANPIKVAMYAGKITGVLLPFSALSAILIGGVHYGIGSVLQMEFLPSILAQAGIGAGILILPKTLGLLGDGVNGELSKYSGKDIIRITICFAGNIFAGAASTAVGPVITHYFVQDAAIAHVVNVGISIGSLCFVMMWKNIITSRINASQSAAQGEQPASI